MLHNMKLPGFFYQRFHAFYLFSAQQREQLLHLAATNRHKSVVLLYVYLSHILAHQPPFLYRKPTISTLFSFVFLAFTYI